MAVVLVIMVEVTDEEIAEVIPQVMQKHLLIQKQVGEEGAGVLPALEFAAAVAASPQQSPWVPALVAPPNQEGLAAAPTASNVE